MRRLMGDEPDEELAAAAERSLMERFLVTHPGPRDLVRHRTVDESWQQCDSDPDEYNLVHLVRFADEEADARIDARLAWYAARGQGTGWVVAAASAPRDLLDRLLARGLVVEQDQPLMARRLDDVEAVTSHALPEGARVRVVTEAAELDDLLEAYRAAYDMTPAETETRRRVLHETGVGEGSPFRHFLGTVGGRAAACASLYRHGETAEVFSVGTAPEARHQGLGAAVTLAALRAAREEGHRVATLMSSALGEPMYRRLGFREVGRLRVLETKGPAAAGAPDAAEP